MTDRICIIGGTSVDTIVHLDQLPDGSPQTIWPRECYRAVGSTGSGKAYNMKALGMDVCLHTILGSDPEADIIQQQMADRKIRLLIDRSNEPTEQHVNLMGAAGERISIFTHPSVVPEHIDWQPVKEAMESSDLIVVNILEYAKPALALAMTTGKIIWTDLHDYDGLNDHHQPFIDAADIIFLSSDNFPGYREFMQQMITRGKQFVVCTHGGQGATLLNDKGEWIEQPVFKVDQVRDTNGAGDAFFSGFLFGYLKGYTLSDCMQLAAACGALCVTSKQLAGEDLNSEHLIKMANLPD
ncbi:carbohydrate kinase family protein [Hahella sp. CCB-MM4]|uniref:carbohydrate kinase family protein n=1 Tax=Hahella sp. (strain CCB-MM4) TaxID=1926491 RepID=UPI000B9B9CED|nr:carbohydrate kinase family protein [Hahella sp. CCB-MM4]OZG71015.1 carbohydrate kinase family protein [Hahella sp. CCB-MM4]